MPREEDNRVGDKLINEVGSQRQLFAYPCIRQSQTPRLKSCPLRYGKRGGGGRGWRFDRIVAAMLQFTLLDRDAPRC